MYSSVPNLIQEFSAPGISRLIDSECLFDERFDSYVPQALVGSLQDSMRVMNNKNSRGAFGRTAEKHPCEEAICAYGRASMGVPPINDYRNPNLAAGLHLLGYVQRFNAGLTIARKACAANGNPPPDINAHPATSVVS